MVLLMEKTEKTCNPGNKMSFLPLHYYDFGIVVVFIRPVRYFYENYLYFNLKTFSYE